MSDIILPKRVPALLTHRRSVDAPTAADVPTIDPAVARDPGLNVPRGAFGGDVIDSQVRLGQTVTGIASDVLKAVERQNKLNDATEKEKAKDELLSKLRAGLAIRQDEADFAEDPVRSAFNAFIDTQIDETKTRARALTGAARLSDGAMARLDLDDIGQVFRDRSDTLHLQGVEQRGFDQLTRSVDEAAVRSRRFVGAAPGDEARFTLGAELDMLDEAVAGFDGAFKANNEQDIRAKGRTRIIEAGLNGMAEAGRGEEAKALLQHVDFAGELDQATSARLTNNIDILSLAHDRDRTAREQREAAEETSARARAAIAFTTGFRPRMATGEATHGEIATAETDGVLTTAQANRLRTEMADTQTRRETASARAGRITSALQTGNRLDPEDFDDHDDVAHHYAATLKPLLAELDPAQKAAAISGYVTETGIAPDAALNSLLGLAATGEAEDRIAAARALNDILGVAPPARDKVPPALAAHAEILALLAGTDTIPPNDIVKTAETLFKKSEPGVDDDKPDPALILLASARTKAQPGASPETAAESDAAPTDDIEESEGGDDDNVPQTDHGSVAEGQISGSTGTSSEPIQVATALPDQPAKQSPQFQPKSEERPGQERNASQGFSDETTNGPVQLAQTAAGSKPQPFVVPGSKASGDATNPRTDPYSKSFLSARFRFELHKRESKVLNYQDRQKGGEALGRY